VKAGIRGLTPERAREFLLGSFSFSIAYVLSFVPIPATDFFWQVATGRFVLRHGVPHFDPFSHTVRGRPWTAHEWLSCVLFAAVFDGLGPEAVLRVKALICALSLLAVYLACRARGASQWASLPPVLLCALTLRPFFDLRPQVLTYLMLASLLALSWRAVRGGKLWLPFLFLPFQALWANIQGGFILGPAVSLLFSLGLAIGRKFREAFSFSLLLPALLIASSLNPYGPRHLLYPLGYAGLKTVYAQAVVEWQPPDLRSPHFWPFEATLLLLLALGPLASRRGEEALPDLALLLPTLHLALCVRKHVPIFSIVSAPTLSLWLGRALSRPEGAGGARPSIYLLASLPLLSFLPFVPFRGGAFERFAVLSYFPVGAANFLEGRGLPPRLFNPYDWGGYLIFRLWPKYLVFIDGRTDLYGEFVVRDYREALGRRWEAVLNRYHVGTALVRPWTDLYWSLRRSGRWREVYRDRGAAVFVRLAGRGSNSSSQTPTQGVEKIFLDRIGR